MIKVKNAEAWSFYIRFHFRNARTTSILLRINHLNRKKNSIYYIKRYINILINYNRN